jgi:septum formation protein
MRMILASASPRRKEILSGMGFQFEVIPSDADESFSPDTPAAEIPRLLSLRKGEAVKRLHPSSLVIAADTVVESDGIILNKPSSREEAESMLSRLSGKMHQVHSGYSIFSNERIFSGVDTTGVWFRALRKSEISWYIDHCQVFDKAGAYGIQDWIGLVGVSKIEGSYFTVMGLPAHLIWEEVRKAGYFLPGGIDPYAG